MEKLPIIWNSLLVHCSYCASADNSNFAINLHAHVLLNSFLYSLEFLVFLLDKKAAPEKCGKESSEP